MVIFHLVYLKVFFFEGSDATVRSFLLVYFIFVVACIGSLLEAVLPILTWCQTKIKYQSDSQEKRLKAK